MNIKENSIHSFFFLYQIAFSIFLIQTQPYSKRLHLPYRHHILYLEASQVQVQIAIFSLFYFFAQYISF